MLVKDWMTKNPITLEENAGVLEAANAMRMNKIRQIPVLDSSQRLVGIVTDRDVRDAMPSKYLPGDTASVEGEGLSGLKLGDIMSLDPLTIGPNATVDVAADILRSNKIGGLPVVDDDGDLLGIITETDVLNFLCAVTGASSTSGIQLIFELEDKPGALVDLLSFLRGEKVRFRSIVTTSEKCGTGYFQASVRVKNYDDVNIDNLIEKVKDKYNIYCVQDGKAVIVS